MEIEPGVIRRTDTESIKLIKNTKSYNWEIKLLGDLNEAQLKRLMALNQRMFMDYPSS